MTDLREQGGERIEIRFWGVRGSLPTPGTQMMRYGGETICFEIKIGGQRVIVDCGSGARRLGKALLDEAPLDVDILFTHSHLDHVCGLPFFKPAYMPGCSVRLWAGHLPSAEAHREAISRLMSPPLFPVKPKEMRACQFRHFTPGDRVVLPSGIEATTVALNHPGGATGYRFDHQGASVCIITDHEHGNAEVDAALEDFVRGADIMAYDAAYTEADYPRFIGWGHSTWEKALDLAERAGVKVPVMIHHDIYRTDDALDELLSLARERFPAVIAGYEGLVLKI